MLPHMSQYSSTYQNQERKQDQSWCLLDTLDSDQLHAGKLEKALGAANTPLLKPKTPRSPSPASGARSNSPQAGARPNSPKPGPRSNSPVPARAARDGPSSRPSSPLRKPSSTKHVSLALNTQPTDLSKSAIPDIDASQPRTADTVSAQVAVSDDSAASSSDAPAQQPADSSSGTADSSLTQQQPKQEAAPAASSCG